MQNLIVYNLNDALMILNNHPNSKINLIDFENICGDKEKLKLVDHGINDCNCVNIFFFNACIYSNQYYSTIKNSSSINVQVITMDVEDQLVDHMITYYLGAFLALHPKNTYNIISTDHGYSAFVNNLNMQNINMIGVGEFIANKEKRYRFSLANYCVKNKYMKNGVCLTRRDLHEVLKDFITKNKNMDTKTYELTLDETLDNLCKYKIFKLTKATDNYDEYYTVDLTTAASIINGYKG